MVSEEISCYSTWGCLVLNEPLLSCCFLLVFGHWQFDYDVPGSYLWVFLTWNLLSFLDVLQILWKFLKLIRVLLPHLAFVSGHLSMYLLMYLMSHISLRFCSFLFSHFSWISLGCINKIVIFFKFVDSSACSNLLLSSSSRFFISVIVFFKSKISIFLIISNFFIISSLVTHYIDSFL